MTHLSPELFDHYLDGELTPVERAACEAHLADCAACREELAALGAFFSELDALPPVALPGDLAPAVLKHLAGTPRWSMGTWGLLAAQLALTLAIGLALLPVLLARLPAGLSEILARLSFAGIPALFSRLQAWPATLPNLLDLASRFDPGPLPALAPLQWMLLLGAGAMCWLAGNRLLLTGAGGQPDQPEVLQ